MLDFNHQLDSAASRITGAVARARSLAGLTDSADGDTRREAIAFSLERAAWAAIELAQAWVYELRLGIPRKETEAFDLLQRHGWIDLELARRLKQLCEFRSLSRAAGSAPIDWAYVGGDLTTELALFESWREQASREWRERRPA